MEAMDFKRTIWAKRWTSANPDDAWHRLHTALDRARSLAVDETLAPLTLEHRQRCLPLVPARTGRGVDNLGPRDVAEIGPAGQQALLDLFHQAERALAWP